MIANEGEYYKIEASFTANNGRYCNTKQTVFQKMTVIASLCS